MIAVLLLAALCPSLADSQYLALPSDLPVRDGVLGLRTQTLTADSLIIDKVLLHSPAHRAGIRRGDRLIAVGAYRVRTTDELARSIASHAPGATLPPTPMPTQAPTPACVPGKFRAAGGSSRPPTVRRRRRCAVASTASACVASAPHRTHRMPSRSATYSSRWGRHSRFLFTRWIWNGSSKKQGNKEL